MNCAEAGIELCPNCKARTPEEKRTAAFICWIEWYRTRLDEWVKMDNVKQSLTIMLTKVHPLIELQQIQAAVKYYNPE